MTTNPSDWFQHVDQHDSAAPPPSSGSGVTANSISPPHPTTATASILSFSQLGLAISGSGSTTTLSTSHQPSPPQAGWVSKPTRRRKRASKKTPTTQLNTDTANFRSMVQRYTGGPSSCVPPPSLTIGGPVQEHHHHHHHHQGQVGNFHEHGTSSFGFGLGTPSDVDHLPAHNPPQQYGGGFSSTVSFNAGSSSSTAVNRRMRIEEEIEFFSLNRHLGPAGGSSDQSSPLGGGSGGCENKGNGFMF